GGGGGEGGGGGGAREADREDKKGARLHLDVADRKVAAGPDPPERQRVGYHVARAREYEGDERVERERDRQGGADPADRGAALDVGLDREEVRARRGRGADDDPGHQGAEEADAADARLRDGPGARRDEQSGEHGEADEVAVGEVDDTGQAVDERVADGDEPVDGTRRP